ncbi:TonB-dependent hemoglobin/transferrin/lactoferrin family receptor [Allopusillimonas ginsengisoli]|uniref:TonB-dependent hemoglobin/transferrin/lactoferrin family receptor n=1 Tax=Allopusillimonas ginsengisoli TaxID=453575 RepID=UPI0010210844|nr:TonB-dependent hemoglobin/transferrin/lactoferrin family receptor [Allopusillimonas ginsengisoli]TEA78604.1 TonB-dependent hemoglobin/transferrin/lactoferrin family receptor [Allopusillimonas ginsengisoli]
MTTRSQVWWGGICLAMVALPAVSQQQTSAIIEANAPQLAEAGNIHALSAVRVQGERIESELPEGASTTFRETLVERSIESWDDFSKRGEPGVNVNQRNNSINIRGMDQDRVVTRVDGVRIPWLNDGARGVKGGINTIDFNTLSSIDLVRGTGAPQSGSLVGYVDLHTLSPDDLLGTDKHFGALLKSGYDSADDSWGADAALAGRLGQGDTSWLLQLGQRKGHERDNQGEQGGYGYTRDKGNPESYTQRNVMLKLQHAINPEHRIGVSGERFHRTADIDNRLEQGNATYDIGNNQSREALTRERVLLSYDFNAAQERAPVDAGAVRLYWQRSKLLGGQSAIRNMDGRGNISFGPGFPVGQIYGLGYPYGPYGRDNTMQESGYGLSTDWSGYWSTGALAHHWAVGGEWYGTRVKQNSSGYDNCPAGLPPWPESLQNALGPRNCDLLHTNQSDMPEAKGDVWSFWAQDKLSWHDGRYALTPALRFDSYRYKPESGGSYAENPNASVTSPPSASGQRVSPSLLATFRPGQNLSVYAKYGYGYRAPNATELYMNYGAPGTYLRVGNPNLDAEVSRGWELGADIGNADLGGRVSFFDNRYRNFIDEDVTLTPDSPQWNPAWSTLYPMGVSGFVNRDRVRIYGAEASAHWNINSNWYTWGSVAWAHGRDQDTGRYLNSVAPLKALLALGYRQEQWGAEAIATLAARRTQVEYPAPEAAPGAPDSDFEAPGYGLLDLSAWWKPQAIKGLRVQAGVYNVFDKTYWNALNVPRPGGRGDGPIDSYTEPGRSVRVSLYYQY